MFKDEPMDTVKHGGGSGNFNLNSKNVLDAFVAEDGG